MRVREFAIFTILVAGAIWALTRKPQQTVVGVVANCDCVVSVQAPEPIRTWVSRHIKISPNCENGVKLAGRVIPGQYNRTVFLWTATNRVGHDKSFLTHSWTGAPWEHGPRVREQLCPR